MKATTEPICNYALQQKCKNENHTCLISPKTVSGTPLVMASVDMFKIGCDN